MNPFRCSGWTPPSSLFFGPQINSLSSYQSPAGSETIVSIQGANFYSYSRIAFGTLSPTVYFINSNILQFYVPNTLSSGTFPVQVFNGAVASNSVNYTIDNASGYWLLGASGSISNTNTANNGGVNVTWLSRGAPVTITNTTGAYTPSTPYIIPSTVNWLITKDDSGGAFYLDLPTTGIGREFMVKTLGTLDVYSTLTNIYPLQSNSVLTDVVVAGGSGNWSTLVFDGTNWTIMQANWS